MPKTPARETKVTRSKAATQVRSKYDDIRQDLEQQRASLLNEAGDLLTNRQDMEAFPDVTDQASAEVDSNFELRLKEREQKLLKKIDEALDRISSNTYGTCERCGEEIPHKRLKARPVTTLCIECKTQQEAEEKVRR
ncbi:MAG TPA: RNA polymerase-binding protein DksA [Nitrospirales bacterium]|nr:RNA polymerase-binding protein DksA [Nitrospirales bacterium]